MAQAVPVPCEVNAETGLIDPDHISSLITPRTKAIVPVHLYGQMCDMVKIAQIAQQHQITIVEDGAQAILATHDQKQAGGWGLATAFSFYPSKNLGAYGDAGAVVTNHQSAYEQALRLRHYGQSNRYVHDEFGFNSRIDELQAAILRVKLPFVPAWIERRRQIAKFYDQHLKVGQPLQSAAENYHTYHLYVTRVEKRDAFMAFCQEHELPVLIHYPKAIYQQPAFKHPVPQSCPIAEKLATQIVSLPIHPYLSDEQVEKICEIVNEFKV
jgi:dTDP-4-amino-4,6-dideoxygalactose transaminase